VIGGATGAAPPLLGWFAVTGHYDPNALLLVLIIFTWTPPHFWALAIHKKDEYKRANVPMLPVTHGIDFTKLCVTLYTILLLAVSVLPFVVGMSSWIYLTTAVILGIMFLYYAVKLQFGTHPLNAIRTFKFSILYLFLLFIGLLVDHFVLGLR
jgi:protoheme IX farnesyltransferase